MRKILALLTLTLSLAAPLRADELPAAPAPALSPVQAVWHDLSAFYAPQTTMLSRAVHDVENALERALDFIGVRYRRGGNSPESGFDCSGFVRYIYGETLGLLLPHSAKAIAEKGKPIDKDELKPGDLVFFNTMRRAFSHVGIYLGDNLFIHAPRAGKRVRIEDMTDRYWSRRFNGARRLQP